MKVFFAACVACLVVSCSASPAPDRKEKFEALLKSCQEKVGATEADLAELKDHSKPPESDGAKKILACTMKEDKLIVDGKFSTEGALDVARKMLEGKPDMEKKLEMAKGVTEKCGTEVNEKPPESEEALAINILACLVKNSKDAGLVLHDELE